MSTTWAGTLIADSNKDSHRLGHMEALYQAEIKALEADNEALAKENAELRARLHAKHAARFKSGRTRRKYLRNTVGTPASDQPRKPRGAPAGHPPWTRTMPSRIDRRIHVTAPHTCPHCHTSSLAPTGATHTHLQEDIVLQPQPVVTAFVHDLAYCPTCHREVFAKADDELRNCQIGPVTKATAVYLRHAVKLSYRDVRLVFRDLFGMPFVPASAMAFDRTIAERGISLYEDLREKIRAADIAYADETHWRIDGRSAYMWFAGTPHLAFFHIDHSRASDVAVSILTDSFRGKLCTDGYAAYNAVNAPARQSCLAHLSTKAKEIIAEINLLPERRRDQEALALLTAIRTLISRACRVGAARNGGRMSQAQARRFIPRFLSWLNTICLRPVTYQKAEQFRQRLLDPDREYRRWFTFLDVPGMEPTNNLAEQALRLPVIFRKICFGNRSDEGAQSMAILLSLVSTARRQKHDPRALIQTLLTRGSEYAGAALFTPPPQPQKPDSS